MQVCLNEYLCRCLRIWQVQWRCVVSGYTGALNGHDTLDCKAFHIDAADPHLDTGTDSEGINRQHQTHEGKCRRTTVPLKTVVRLRADEDAVNR